VGLGRTGVEMEAEAAPELRGKAWWLFRIRNGACFFFGRENGAGFQRQEHGHGLTADLNLC